MTDTELDNMVIRLTGDSSSYRAMLEEAERSTNMVAADVEAAQKRIQSMANDLQVYGRTESIAQAETRVRALAGEIRKFGDAVVAARQPSAAFNLNLREIGAAASSELKNRFDSLSRSVRSFGQSVLGAFGAFGMSTSIQGALDAFVKLERGQLRLGAAIESNGADVQETTEDYLAFSKSITENTLATKGDVMALLTEAESLGKTGEAAKRVALNAIALAKGDGDAAKGMVRVAAGLEDGNLQMVRRVLHLHNVKDETELLAKVTERMGRNMKIAMADAGSLGGQMQKLWRSLKSLNEEFGRIVAEYAQPVVSWLTLLATNFKSMEPATKSFVVKLIAITAAVLAAGPAWTALTYALAPTVALVSALSSAFMFLVSTPLGLTVTGIAAATAALFYFTDAGQEKLEQFGAGWEDFRSDAAKGIAGIKDALMAGDVPLAADVMWVQLKISWAKGTASLSKGWLDFTSLMKMAWIDTAEFLKTTWLKVWGGMIATFYDILVFFGAKTREEADDAAADSTAEIEKSIAAVKKARDAAAKDVALDRKLELAKAEDDLDRLMKKRDELAKKAAEATKPDRKPLEPPVIKPIPPQKVRLEPVWKATAFNSAEALARYTKYQEELQYGKAGKEAPSVKAVAGGSADALAREGRNTELLKEIRDALKTKGPAVELEPGDLPGA